jgi:DNA polymerase III alpha subunit
LESSQFEPDPLTTVLEVSQELSDFGIKLLPPSLEKSQMNFTKEGNDIRYGLNSIKGISAKSLQALVDFRGHKFNNKYEVFIAAKESGLSIAILAALIQAGAMEHAKDRSRLVLEAQAFNLLTDREKRNFCKIGERFGYDVLNSIAEIVEKKILGDDNKPIINGKRFETFKRNFSKYREIYKHNRKFEKFANWWYENTLLGYGYSMSIRDCFADEFGMMSDTSVLKEMDEQNNFKTAVQVSDVYSKTSAAGNKYMRITAGDERGSLGFMFMDNQREAKLTNFLAKGGKVNKGDVVILSGTRSGDAYFVDNMKVVDTQIYMKSSQFKDNGTETN